MRSSRLPSDGSLFYARGAEQPVDWWPFGEGAFARARELGRPLLVCLGTGTSHACHTLDVESFDEPQVAAALDARFVAVRVDADERPELDDRYQALAGNRFSAWPLVCVIASDGSFVSARSHLSRGGLERLLADPFGPPPPVAPALVGAGLATIRASFDAAFGGFGPPPKLPHAPVLDLLLSIDEPWALPIAVRTLDALAQGGIHDQLAGGFHRYSTDDKWIVPHFEKRAADQAALLSTFVRAYLRTGQPRYAAVARGVVDYALSRLADPRGGFACAEDCDLAPYDDGSHYTWSLDEATAILDADELACAQPRWDLYGRGELHSDPTRNVLFLANSVDDIAYELRRAPADVEALLARAHKKLAAARALRPQPPLDRGVRLGPSAHLARALIEADRALSLPAARIHALLTLERLSSEAPVHWLDDVAQLGLLQLAAAADTSNAAAERPAAALLAAPFLDAGDGIYSILDGACASGAALGAELLFAVGESDAARALIVRHLPAASAAGLRGAGLIRLAMTQSDK